MNGINDNVVLRKTVPGDLETLFIHQLDGEAAYMAAFVNEQWKDRDAYLARWSKLLADEVNIRTIVLGDVVVGSISTWKLVDELQISYWVGREFWNRGIATSALRQFLAMVPERPLYGRVAFDNIGSASVLVKCGFKRVGEDRFYAHARQQEIAEIIYVLEG